MSSRSAIDDRLLTNNNSPLHLACSGGHLEAVEALVAASADVNSGNSYGNAPIHGALVAGHRAVRQWAVLEGGRVDEAGMRPQGVG